MRLSASRQSNNTDQDLTSMIESSTLGAICKRKTTCCQPTGAIEHGNKRHGHLHSGAAISQAGLSFESSSFLFLMHEFQCGLEVTASVLWRKAEAMLAVQRHEVMKPTTNDFEKTMSLPAYRLSLVCLDEAAICSSLAKSTSLCQQQSRTAGHLPLNAPRVAVRSLLPVEDLCDPNISEDTPERKLAFCVEMSCTHALCGETDPGLEVRCMVDRLRGPQSLSITSHVACRLRTK